MKFSANLGFLWADLPLTDAIHAARDAGFDAIECHWPFDSDPGAINRALSESGLPMLGLNTHRGDVAKGEFGLSALPGREVEARAMIDEAIDYARAVSSRAVHVMAGIATGTAAEACFRENLIYACEKAEPHGLTILIEPLNTKDVEGYFLTSTEHALRIIEDLGHPQLKLMFDIYHEQINQGDVLEKLQQAWPHLGHIQFASAPDRGAPAVGDRFFETVFTAIETKGWCRPLGAEYKVAGKTEDTLQWLQDFKDRAKT